MVPEDVPHVCQACGEAAHTDAEHELECTKATVVDLETRLREMTSLEAMQAARVSKLLGEIGEYEKKALIARQDADALSEMPEHPSGKSIKQTVTELAREVAQLREQVAELRGERKVEPSKMEQLQPQAAVGLDVQKLRAKVDELERQLAERSAQLTTYKNTANQFLEQRNAAQQEVRDLRGQLEKARANVPSELSEEDGNRVIDEVIGEVRAEHVKRRQLSEADELDLTRQVAEAHKAARDACECGSVRRYKQKSYGSQEKILREREMCEDCEEVLVDWHEIPFPDEPVNPTTYMSILVENEEKKVEEEAPSVESMCGFPDEHREELLSSIRLLQKKCHQLSVAKGWYNPPKTVLESLALIVEEAAEAMRHYRRSKNDKDLLRVWLDGKDRKPEGFPVELSDLIIRSLDLAEYLGIDIVAYVLMKHHYNLDRPYRHGDCRA